MFFYVYLLKSLKTKKYYVGYTSDLKRRISEHNQGDVTSTKRDIPWELVYFEGYTNKHDAQKRERKLKHHGQGIRRLKERLST